MIDFESFLPGHGSPPSRSTSSQQQSPAHLNRSMTPQQHQQHQQQQQQQNRSSLSPQQQLRQQFQFEGGKSSFWKSHAKDMLEPTTVHQISQDEACDVEYVFGRPGHGTLFVLDTSGLNVPNKQQHQSLSILNNSNNNNNSVDESCFELVPALVRITGIDMTVSPSVASSSSSSSPTQPAAAGSFTLNQGAHQNSNSFFSFFNAQYVADGIFCDEDSASCKAITGLPCAFTFVTTTEPIRRVTLTATPDSKSQDVLWSLKRLFDSRRNGAITRVLERDDEEEDNNNNQGGFGPTENNSGYHNNNNNNGSPSGTRYKVQNSSYSSIGRGNSISDTSALAQAQSSVPMGSVTWSAIERVVHHPASPAPNSFGDNYNNQNSNVSNVSIRNASTVSSKIGGGGGGGRVVTSLDKFNSDKRNVQQQHRHHLDLAFAAFDDVIHKSTLSASSTGIITGGEEDDGEDEEGVNHHHHHNNYYHHRHELEYGDVDPVAAALARRQASKMIRATPNDYHPLTSVPIPGASSSPSSGGGGRLKTIGPAHPLAQLQEGDGAAHDSSASAQFLFPQGGQPPQQQQQQQVRVGGGGGGGGPMTAAALLGNGRRKSVAGGVGGVGDGIVLSGDQLARMEKLEQEVSQSDGMLQSLQQEMERMREQLTHVQQTSQQQQQHAGPSFGSVHSFEARQVAERAIKRKGDGSIILDFDSVLQAPATKTSANNSALSTQNLEALSAARQSMLGVGNSSSGGNEPTSSTLQKRKSFSGGMMGSPAASGAFSENNNNSDNSNNKMGSGSGLKKTPSFRSASATTPSATSAAVAAAGGGSGSGSSVAESPKENKTSVPPPTSVPPAGNAKEAPKPVVENKPTPAPAVAVSVPTVSVTKPEPTKPEPKPEPKPVEKTPAPVPAPAPAATTAATSEAGTLGENGIFYPDGWTAPPIVTKPGLPSPPESIPPPRKTTWPVEKTW